MFLKKLLRCMLFIICLSVMTNCKKQEIKELTIGLSSDYPPFVFEYRNELIGFEVDLVKAICERLKYKINFKTMGFEELFSALENNNIDLAISAITKTEEREKKFDFSYPYYKPNFVLVFKKDKIKQIHNLHTVDGMIGVENGTTMENYLKDFQNAINNDKKTLEIKLYKRNSELISALKSDAVNAILLELLEGEVATQNDRDLSYIMLPISKHNKEEYGITFKKDSKLLTEFNKVLTTIDSEGKIDILKLRWFSSYGMYGDPSLN